MHLKLAELIESVPSEFTEKRRTSDSITYQHGNKKILIEWWHNGQPFDISYYEKGACHRPSTEGPATQLWHNNGKLYMVLYFENGKRHRPSAEGPAYQYYDESGQPVEISYWEYGEKVKIK